jgi:HK97 family phage prohead protease
MSDDMMMGEYEEDDQRMAVCQVQWDDSKKAAKGAVERKALSVSLKEGEEGSFVARIATLNVRDKDNDITLQGAFPVGKTVLVSAYMHGSWMGKLPIGKATIRETGNDVIAEGQFNLQTSDGRDTYEAMKFAPELAEWSYGFYPLEHEEGQGDNAGCRILKKVDVKEISPVLVGAGVNTAILAIKSEGQSLEAQVESALAANEIVSTRIKSLADLRRKEGRVLSTANRERMKSLLESLSTVAADLKELLDATEPKDSKANLQAVLLMSRIRMNLSEVS